MTAIIVEPLSSPSGNLVAEASVVAACLNNPESIYDVGSGLRAEHFTDDRVRLIWEAIHGLATDGFPIDPTTVVGRMRDHGTLDKVGGEDGVERARLAPHNVEHVVAHATLILNMARVRTTLDVLRKATREGDVGPGDVAKWLDGIGHRVENAANGGNQSARGNTIGDVFSKINARLASTASSDTVGTGFKRLDRLIGRMRPGQLIMIGGWSKHGKSALAAQIAEHVACNEVVDGKRAGVGAFILEMDEEEYVARLWCTAAGVNNRLILSDMNRDYIDTERMGHLKDAQLRLRKAPIKVFDDPGISPSQIRAELRRLAAQWKRDGEAVLRVAVVDYAQILSPDQESGRRRDNREQEVASISRTLKKIAQELRITVILLAQLNDDGKKDNRAPRASDMRESRALFFDANAVILIDNPAMDEDPVYVDDNDPERFNVNATVEADILVAAVRGGGERGKLRVNYRPGCTRFERWNPAEGDAQGRPKPLRTPRSAGPAGAGNGKGGQR